jgi:hypothetical protein
MVVVNAYRHVFRLPQWRSDCCEGISGETLLPSPGKRGNGTDAPKLAVIQNADAHEISRGYRWPSADTPSPYLTGAAACAGSGNAPTALRAMMVLNASLAAK